jgi:hypothetical protein
LLQPSRQVGNSQGRELACALLSLVAEVAGFRWHPVQLLC